MSSSTRGKSTPPLVAATSARCSAFALGTPTTDLDLVFFPDLEFFFCFGFDFDFLGLSFLEPGFRGERGSLDDEDSMLKISIFRKLVWVRVESQDKFAFQYLRKLVYFTENLEIKMTTNDVTVGCDRTHKKTKNA